MNAIAPKPDLLLSWMESLSDPKRLRMLKLLERQELGVAELCDVLQSPQSTISRHLKLLSDSSWLQSRRQGTNRLYSMVLDELEPAARRLWVLTRQQIDAWPSVAQDQLRLDRLLAHRNDGEAFFDSAATQWDTLRAELYGQHFSQAACLALIPHGLTIADLGCGTGHIASMLSPFAGRIIGVEKSAAMLKAAQRRLTNVSNVELRRGDLAQIPIETASCDAALLVLALTYVENPRLVIGEMARILKPAGRAVVVDLLTHDRDDFRRQYGQTWRGFELTQIEQWFSEADLQNATGCSLPPEANVKGPALFLFTGEAIART